MEKFAFDFTPEEDGSVDENLEVVAEIIQAMMANYEAATERIEAIAKNVYALSPMLAIVKRRALPTSPAAYGPFALEVYVPEMGDDATITRIAECERASSGRIVIPKKGSYVTVYLRHGSASKLVWRGMGIEGFPSLTKEQRSTKFRQLAVDPIVTDIDIYESNDDFEFLLDRTIPGLHELLLELSSPLGQIKIKTGNGGKILIGNGGTLVDLELDVGGAIKILAGATPAGTIDIVGGGDITISAGALGNIIADGLTVDLTAGVSNILMTAASIQLKGGASAVIEPAALATSLNAVLTAPITEMSSHSHPGPGSPSSTGAATAAVVNPLLPNILSKGVTLN